MDRILNLLLTPMKKSILVLILISLFTTNYAQNESSLEAGLYTPPAKQELYYNVSPNYKRPLTKEKIKEAKLLSDLIDGYPTNWISSYVVTEILTTSKGNTVTTKGKNEVLTNEQKKTLYTAEIGSEVAITVKYIYDNPITNKKEDKEMYVEMTLAPDVEATYIEDNEKLINYFKENTKDKVSKSLFKDMEMARFGFTIDEQGKAVNAKVKNSTGDNIADKVIIDLINTMPNWKPAKDLTGKSVQQEFEFSVGKGGC